MEFGGTLWRQARETTGSRRRRMGTSQPSLQGHRARPGPKPVDARSGQGVVLALCETSHTFGASHAWPWKRWRKWSPATSCSHSRFWWPAMLCALVAQEWLNTQLNRMNHKQLLSGSYRSCLPFCKHQGCSGFDSVKDYLAHWQPNRPSCWPSTCRIFLYFSTNGELAQNSPRVKPLDSLRRDFSAQHS